MQCPKCGGNLQVALQDDIEVDRCDQCGGLWFDVLELERLREVRGSEAVDVGDPGAGAGHNAKGKVHCPRGHGQMIRMVDLEQHHIWYESCPICYGKWFDAGEFADLKHETVVDFFRDLFARERK